MSQDMGAVEVPLKTLRCKALIAGFLVYNVTKIQCLFECFRSLRLRNNEDVFVGRHFEFPIFSFFFTQCIVSSGDKTILKKLKSIKTFRLQSETIGNSNTLYHFYSIIYTTL